VSGTVNRPLISVPDPCSVAHNGSGHRRLSLGEKLEVYAKVFGLKAY
jgi:hypothetical protein